MAKFTSKKLDLVVSTENGFIKFKNGEYETTNAKEIKALEKALDAEQVQTTARRKTTTKEDEATL